MIKTYHEAPKSIFKQVQSMTDGDYALVNLFDDEEYVQQFDPKHRDTILDNGVFELGKAFDSDVFAAWVEKFQPTWYIVPDVLEDGEATIERFMEFIGRYRGLPGKIIGVAQGKDYNDYVKCYKAIEPYCDKIGMSFDCSWYREGMKSDNPWVQLAGGRVRNLIKMDDAGVINRRKPHHLLGVALPQEMEHYQLFQRSGTFEWIDSVDTSNPVVHGLKGIAYSSNGLYDKESQKLYTMINAEVSPDQMHTIEHNIRQFWRFCNG